jgi:RNA recognition motif-containing protein
VIPTSCVAFKVFADYLPRRSSMKLFIGSLPYDITESELKDIFSSYGDIVSAKLITDHLTGQSKGFGFVEMATRSEGHKAMEDLNGKEYKHRRLVCNEAKVQKKKGSRRR